ncbi:MAG: LamG domain-containing protein [Bacteriovoracaceae bacterium]|nr:LamG domain-containing protein [Bacteriovoracaceae bacterium]
MKHLRSITLFIVTLILSSCLDRLPESISSNFCPGTRQEDGSCPVELRSDSWSFNTATNYSYDTNYVEITSDAATLKSVDQQHLGADFNNGTHAGTFLDSNNNLTLGNKFAESIDLRNILSDKTQFLEGYWRFENSPNNSSSNNLSSVDLGTPSYSSSSKIGTHAHIDRSGLNGVYTSNIPYSATFSVSTWIKINKDNSWRRTFVKGLDQNSSNIDWYLIENDSGKYRFSITNACYGDYVDLPKNVWTNLIITYGDGALNMYVDGELLYTKACSTPPENKGSNLNIGANLDGWSPVEAEIDEFSLWSTVLTIDDVKKIYNSQSLNNNELSSLWTPKFSNIIGYWKMDGSWRDSSTNGNNATANGDATFSEESKVGLSSGTFDGTGDYVSIPDNSDFDFTGNDFSIAGWFKADSTSTARIGIFGHSLPGYLSIFIRDAGQSNEHHLIFETRDSNSVYRGVVSTKELRDDSWHHFVAIRDNDNDKLSIYIDGELDSQSTDTRTGSFNFTSTIRLGRDSSGLNFDGLLDDMAVWNAALDSNDVTTIYERQKQQYVGHYDSPIIDLGTNGNWNSLKATTTIPFMKGLTSDNGSESSADYPSLSTDLSNQLVGYWPFNETTLNSVGGSDFKDFSPSTNHGEESGGVSPGESGIISKATFYDGVDDYVSISHSPDISFGSSTDFTISFWAKTYKTDEVYSVLLGKRLTRATERKGYQFRLENQNLIVAISDGVSAPSITSNTSISDGEWHQITATFDRDGNGSLYIDGKLDGTPIDISAVGDIDEVAADLVLGSIGFKSANYHRGKIDEVSIWRRLLDTTEIQQLYRRGANRIKYQVRSCDDASCDTESLIGPDGTAGTYFSEVHNNDIIDSNGTPTGNIKATTPKFLFSDFVTAPSINRYFQYRVYMESDDNNSACGGLNCVPELTSIELSPAGRYYAGVPTIITDSPIKYKNIKSITISESGSCQIEYQLSNDGTSWYHWDGSNWTLISSDIDRNTKEEVSINIETFSKQRGAGDLHLRAFMISDTTQSCALEEIKVQSGI